MHQPATKEGNITKSSEISVWLSYDRLGFIVLENPSKSPTGLQGSAKRPHGNASASPPKSDVGTDASGTVVETLDYYPYGATRIDSAPSQSQRKYIGQYFDSSTGLNYDNARYQNPTQGQFISQDPVFLGIPKQQNIQDPQSLNPYSYSEDNPIVKSDPTGKVVGVDDVIELALLAAATEPEWEPPLQDAVTDIANEFTGAYGEMLGDETAYGSISSQSEGYNFNMTGSNGSTMQYWAGTQQLTPGPLDTYYQEGGYDAQTFNDYVDWFKNAENAKTGAKIIFGLGGLAFLGYEWPKPESQPSQNFNASNGSGGTGYGTRPTISMPASTRSGSSGGGSGPVLLPGQNSQSKYTFSGGVNAYGESYGNLFPSTKP